jgi:hypothetical protein
LLSLLASCASVSHTLDPRVAAPHSIAVLPVEGTASLAERELARGLLVARLREHGFSVVESQHVDRVLSETGRMTDPDAFRVDLEAIPAIATRIGVDAILHIGSFDETNWNAIALRRHAISASLQIVTKDKSVWWKASHSVGEFGGFALKSGQVITELLAQGAHGQPQKKTAVGERVALGPVARVAHLPKADLGPIQALTPRAWRTDSAAAMPALRPSSWKP